MEQKKVLRKLASRLDGVSESATLKLNATINRLKAEGASIINLTVGEPDLWVPEPAKKAAIQAIESNQSKYTAVAGIEELRAAVALKTNLQQPSLQTPWSSSDVAVTNGGKQALFNAMLALVNPGNRVLIPTPYWLSYPEMVKLCGGVPQKVETTLETHFKLTPQALETALSEETRMVILNSPSNPTGMVYSRAQFAELGAVLQKYPKTFIISDEIYDRLIVGETPFCSFLEACPDLQERTITINGMSKSSAMTGWRVGWSVAEKTLTQAMLMIQGQSTSNINAIAQWASLAALRLPETFFSSDVERFRIRRNLVVQNLKKIPKIEWVAPEGAFYFFVGVGKCLQPGETAADFALGLLEKHNLAVMPGGPFGEPSFIRLSFAVDEALLDQATQRLALYVDGLFSA